jgi:multidrug transporter EmrE-like cation transporter
MPQPVASPSGVDPSRYTLFEVWGDTVDSKHLGIALIVGAVCSLGAYAIALWVLGRIVADAQMVHAYAMLGGIAGCLLGGVISALLFEPKREVIEEAADAAYRETVIADLAKQYGSLGRIEDLPPEIAFELRELGLYDAFREAQHASAHRPAPSAGFAAPATAHGERA